MPYIISAAVAMDANGEWDSVAGVNLLPLSYLFFCYIPIERFRLHSRLMERYKEHNVTQTRNIKAINGMDVTLAGSVAEGFAVFPDILQNGCVPSDVDLMIRFTRDFIVDDTCPNIHPGYTRLINTEKDIGNENGLLYLPTSAILHKTDLELGQSYHGPAVQIVDKLDDVPDIITKCDNVPCLAYPQWPKPAEEWLHRPRPSGWPPHDLIDRIAAGGCHFVPVAHANSTSPDIEWRYSFSHAEVMLANSLTDFQKHVFILFKILVTHAIGKISLKSYYLKNIFFFCCEKIPAEFWKPVNLAACLFILTDEILTRLAKFELHHYFIRDNNLISHIERKSITASREKLDFLRRYPVKCIMEVFGTPFEDSDLFQQFSKEDIFKEIINLCNSRICIYDVLEKSICSNEKFLSIIYMVNGEHFTALNCFTHRYEFFELKSILLNTQLIQSKYLSFLKGILCFLPFTSLVSAFVFLSHKCFWKTDTKATVDLIKCKVEESYETVKSKIGSNRSLMALCSIHYSIYLLMTGHFSLGYNIVKQALTDKDIDHGNIVSMHTAIAIDCDVLTEVNLNCGMHSSYFRLYVLYLGIEYCKKMKNGNEMGIWLKYAYQINELKFGGLASPLLAAKLYMAGNHFIVATEYFCLQTLNTFEAFSARHNILVSLLLEFLQLSSTRQYAEFPGFNQLSVRLLHLTRCHLLRFIDGVEGIGHLLSDLATMYKDATFDEHNRRRWTAAAHAAFICEIYSLPYLNDMDKYRQFLRGEICEYIH